MKCIIVYTPGINASDGNIDIQLRGHKWVHFDISWKCLSKLKVKLELYQSPSQQLFILVTIPLYILFSILYLRNTVSVIVAQDLEPFYLIISDFFGIYREHKQGEIGETLFNIVVTTLDTSVRCVSQWFLPIIKNAKYSACHLNRVT